jgi:hypothetical protein
MIPRQTIGDSAVFFGVRTLNAPVQVNPRSLNFSCEIGCHVWGTRARTLRPTFVIASYRAIGLHA